MTLTSQRVRKGRNASSSRPRSALLVARGAIGGMWLPLATLAGLGSVGCFDYNHTRVYACIVMGALVVIFSVARCFRAVLLAAGVFSGLLSATAIDLYQALHDVMSMGSGDLAQMARQLVAHSSLQTGAFVLPLCGLACVVAGALGSSPGPDGGGGYQ